MKTRTITIAKADIFADVDAETHILARMTEGQDLHRADALESDSGDDLAESLLTRYADRRVAELRQRLSRFLDAETADTADAALSTAADYTLAIRVEEAFQDEMLKPLAQAMEEYIARGVIADWYIDNNEAQAAAHSQQLPGILDEMMAALVSRKFPERS